MKGAPVLKGCPLSYQSTHSCSLPFTSWCLWMLVRWVWEGRSGRGHADGSWSWSSCG